MKGLPLILCSLALVGVRAHGAPVDLKEALKLAVRQSPVLESERQRAAISELELKNAKSRFLPSLDATGSSGIDRRRPASPTDPWSSQLSLALTENLYDNGESHTQYRISQLNREIGYLGYLKARDKLLFDVTAGYYRLLLNGKIAQARGKQLELFKKQFATVNGQYLQGMRTKRDFLRFKSQVERAEIDFREASNTAKKSEVELKTEIGVPSTDESFTFALDDPDVSEVPATRPEASSFYDYRIARLKKEIKPREVDLARRKWLPQLRLTAGAHYSNNGFLGSGQLFNATETYGWNVLVGLNYNLLDWGIRSRELSIAERNRDIEDSQFRRVSLTTEGELSHLMLELSNLKANYAQSRSLVSVEEQAFGALDRDYREGKIASYDLIQGLRDLLDSKMTYYRAFYGLAEGIARHHYYEGSLHEKLGLD